MRMTSPSRVVSCSSTLSAASLPAATMASASAEGFWIVT